MLDELRELLEADEGVQHDVYLDHLGKSTTGVGHLIIKDDLEFTWPVGAQVTEERVTELFEQDTRIALNDARWLQPDLDSWPVAAQITVVSLCFQLGRSRYSGFVKHHKALEREHWMVAAAELRDSKLYRQTPARTERHAKRLEGLAA